MAFLIFESTRGKIKLFLILIFVAITLFYKNNITEFALSRTQMAINMFHKVCVILLLKAILEAKHAQGVMWDYKNNEDYLLIDTITLKVSFYAG